jgi:AcrR family transcriptional regulator
MSTPSETPPTEAPEPPTPDARAQVRRAVLETAARVLADNDQASIDDIARASGVGRATLYRWFTSREQLIDAILDQIIAEATEVAAQALVETSIPPLAVIQSIARELLALGERYRFMQANLERVKEEDQRRDEFTAFVHAAQAAGRLRDEMPPEWVTSVFIGLILTAGSDLHDGRLTRLQAEELIDRTLSRLLERD